MSKLCKRPNCTRLGTARCSACQIESYCSVECQRANWKDHKITCGKKLLSESELNSFVMDAMDEASRFDPDDRTGRNISFLKGAVLYAEYQFGEQVPGECFRRLKNGVTFKNDWLLFTLRDSLTESYVKQNTVASFDTALGYATETRAQLEMRRSNDDDREMFFHNIYRVNTQLGHIFIYMIRYEEALCHMQEALTAAKHDGNENNEKPSNLIQALKNMSSISGLLKNGEGAKYAEEAYNLVSGQHGPEHPEVQEAATCLIDSCLEMRNFVDAERFARITYECLIDPNNTNIRKAVAIGKMQLARVWLRTPPEQRIGGAEAAEEAEKLSRKACDIFENIGRGGFDHPITVCLSMSHATLAEVMMESGKTNSEVERTILRALSFTKECRVGVVPRVASSSHRYDLLQLLARLYFVLTLEVPTKCLDIKLLAKSKYAYEELVIIATALFSPDDDRLLDCIAKVKEIDEALSIYQKECTLSLGEKGG
jgi:tetratricopeptide (TPR) repeat protein